MPILLQILRPGNPLRIFRCIAVTAACVCWLYRTYILLADNVYMLIIKFTFYSLTLKSKAKHINIFWIESHAETCLWRKLFAEMIELKIQNSYQDRKSTSIWFWKIFIVEEILKKQHQQLFNNRKPKIENKTSKIGNCCSKSDSDQLTT